MKRRTASGAFLAEPVVRASRLGWETPGDRQMLIRAGYDIAFECPAQTSMLLQLNVHPSRIEDLRSPDIVRSDPGLAMGAYLDQFGNRVTRVDVPPAWSPFPIAS